MTSISAVLARVRRRVPRRWLALAAALLGVPGAAAAQGGAAGLRVVVTDSATREPVVRAQVSLVGGRRGVTGADGVLMLEPVAAGTWAVEVEHLGYAVRRVLVRVVPDGTTGVAVALIPDPVALAAIAATAAGAAPRTQLLRAFYARAGSGSGQYITRAQIERANPREVADLFHMVPGMVVQSGLNGDRLRMADETVSGVTRERGRSARGTRAQEEGCPILYFLDGTPIEPNGGIIDAEVDPAEVEGIEIYRRGTLAPAQFRRSDNCGVVLIWKRERLEPRKRPDPPPSPRT